MSEIQLRKVVKLTNKFYKFVAIHAIIYRSLIMSWHQIKLHVHRVYTFCLPLTKLKLFVNIAFFCCVHLKVFGTILSMAVRYNIVNTGVYVYCSDRDWSVVSVPATGYCGVS